MSIATSPVPTTVTGIVCGKCSTFTNKVRHASVSAVRMCAQAKAQSAPRITPVDHPGRLQANAEWAEAKNETAKKVEVHAGRYAVEHEGTLKFYRVDVPTEGKWKGYTFVKVQASAAEYPIRNRQSREAILALIAVDPKAAMLRYGIELGHCGHCGRTLTNEESRAAGIGPICSGKMGW